MSGGDFDDRYEDWEDGLGEPVLRNPSRWERLGLWRLLIDLGALSLLTLVFYLWTRDLFATLFGLATGSVVGVLLTFDGRFSNARNKPPRPEPLAEAQQALGDEPGRQAGGDSTSGREGERWLCDLCGARVTDHRLFGQNHADSSLGNCHGTIRPSPPASAESCPHCGATAAVPLCSGLSCTNPWHEAGRP